MAAESLDFVKEVVRKVWGKFIEHFDARTNVDSLFSQKLIDESTMHVILAAKATKDANRAFLLYLLDHATTDSLKTLRKLLCDTSGTFQRHGSLARSLEGPLKLGKVRLPSPVAVRRVANGGSRPSSPQSSISEHTHTVISEEDQTSRLGTVAALDLYIYEADSYQLSPQSSYSEDYLNEDKIDQRVQDNFLCVLAQVAKILNKFFNDLKTVLQRYLKDERRPFDQLDPEYIDSAADIQAIFRKIHIEDFWLNTSPLIRLINVVCDKASRERAIKLLDKYHEDLKSLTTVVLLKHIPKHDISDDRLERWRSSVEHLAVTFDLEFENFKLSDLLAQQKFLSRIFKIPPSAFSYLSSGPTASTVVRWALHISASQAFEILERAQCAFWRLKEHLIIKVEIEGMFQFHLRGKHLPHLIKKALHRNQEFLTFTEHISHQFLALVDYSHFKRRDFHQRGGYQPIGVDPEAVGSDVHETESRTPIGSTLSEQYADVRMDQEPNSASTKMTKLGTFWSRTVTSPLSKLFARFSEVIRQPPQPVHDDEGEGNRDAPVYNPYQSAGTVGVPSGSTSPPTHYATSPPCHQTPEGIMSSEERSGPSAFIPAHRSGDEPEEVGSDVHETPSGSTLPEKFKALDEHPATVKILAQFICGMAPQWLPIATQLGPKVSEKAHSDIDKRQCSDNEKMTRVLNSWIDSGENVCWNNILSAIHKVGMQSLTQEMLKLLPDLLTSQAKPSVDAERYDGIPVSLTLVADFVQRMCGEWYRIAFYFGGRTAIEAHGQIDLDPSPASTKMSKVIEVWIDSVDGDVRWSVLTDALRTVGLGGVANDIRKKLDEQLSQLDSDGGPKDQLPAGVASGSSSSLPSKIPAVEGVHAKPTAPELWKHAGQHMHSEWYKFGVVLQVSENILKSIKQENLLSSKDCFVSLSQQWLRRGNGTGEELRTWRTVLEAVKECGFPDLAKEVKKLIHQGKLNEPEPSGSDYSQPPGVLWQLSALEGLEPSGYDYSQPPGVLWPLSALEGLEPSGSDYSQPPGVLWPLSALEGLYIGDDEGVGIENDRNGDRQGAAEDDNPEDRAPLLRPQEGGVREGESGYGSTAVRCKVAAVEDGTWPLRKLPTTAVAEYIVTVVNTKTSEVIAKINLTSQLGKKQTPPSIYLPLNTKYYFSISGIENSFVVFTGKLDIPQTRRNQPYSIASGIPIPSIPSTIEDSFPFKLKDVLDFLPKIAMKWFEIGTHLDLGNQVRELNTTAWSNQRKLATILQEWEESGKGVSWQTLVNVLETKAVDLGAVAKEIKEYLYDQAPDMTPEPPEPPAFTEMKRLQPCFVENVHIDDNLLAILMSKDLLTRQQFQKIFQLVSSSTPPTEIASYLIYLVLSWSSETFENQLGQLADALVEHDDKNNLMVGQKVHAILRCNLDSPQPFSPASSNTSPTLSLFSSI